MPQTQNYGFDYEEPSSLPGTTLTGGVAGDSPILAVQVDTALASLDSQVNANSSAISTNTSNIASITLPPTVEDDQQGNIENISSTSYVAGSPECAVLFTAPPSGRVKISVSASMKTPSSGELIFVSFEVRIGSTGGTTIVSATDGACIAAQGSGQIFINGFSKLVGSLDPGETYAARTMHRVNGGTDGSLFHRIIIAEPTS
jgi:hypothetical protein